MGEDGLRSFVGRETNKGQLRGRCWSGDQQRAVGGAG